MQESATTIPVPLPTRAAKPPRTRAARPHSRSTPLSARGEPVVWLTGLAMAVCMAMIIALLVLTVVQGVATFWPRPIHRVTLASVDGQEGAVLLGSPIREEAFDAAGGELAALNAARAADPGARLTDGDGHALRRLYRVGNKEFRGQPFEWVPLFRIKELAVEPGAVMLERQQWGVWFGYPEAVVLRDVLRLGPGEEPSAAEGAPAGARVELADLSKTEDGGRTVRRTVFLAEGEGAMAEFGRQHSEALAREAELTRLKTVEVGEINHGLEAARLRFRQAEIDFARTGDGGEGGTGAGRSSGRLPSWAWAACAAGAAAAVFGLVAVRRKAPASGTRRGRRVLAAALACLGFGLMLPVVLEHPFSGPAMTAERLADERVKYDAAAAGLRAEYDRVLGRINALDAEDARYRVIVREPTDGKFAPLRQTDPDEPLRISQVVRAVQPNTLTLAGKVGVYLDRWREFLFDGPREANTEGGIFPVIFGTVLLTLLLSVAVVPLGVIAALYLREYARQGPVTSIIRVAVNNLAGVPSIVYGVFGMGFFCYTLGQYIDRGPAVPWSRAQWWGGIAALMLGLFGAVAAGTLARATPGTLRTPRQKWLGRLAVAGWAACVLGALGLLAGMPMFTGFYEARLPSPTFGTKGMLWAALTLALLTLPVVIVATEEAIAAVPRSMREGSYGCGASKWQTIRRIVLPRAMPGIMTGMILAMARGAGEVAPLMLVGAVKLAPELPVSTEFPFIHLERSFMHLGFHIYDVGFQSPDAEAARPLVWTTTLVLVALVLLLNLTAIRVRSRLRRRFLGGAF